jgi:hypothetical protein
MSETKPTPPQMPLFYKRVTGINPAVHGMLKIDRATGYGFAAHAQSVPIGLAEFDSVAQHYPIVFTAGPAPIPVALLGLRDGQNLFVDKDGNWRRDCYVPAYVRAFPFIFVEDKKSGNTFIAVEPDASCLSEAAGLPLFEDGKPSRTMSDSVAFCTSMRDNLNAARVFGQGLNDVNVLSEEEATINFTSGGTARIRGFKLMQPDKLGMVDDDTFLDWRANGWIGAVYAHLFSAGRWTRLIELAAQDLPAAA